MKPRSVSTEMHELKDKEILVIGLGASAQAAADLLRSRGANVSAVESGMKLPRKHFTLAVVTQGCGKNQKMIEELMRQNVPVISELELGYQESRCLNISVAGTNGKTTVATLIERLLATNNRKSILAGHAGQPVCAVVDQSKEVDFLILRVSAPQLTVTQFFRPAVAVLTSLALGQKEGCESEEEYMRATARIFQNQQAFDWAVVQKDALEKLRALGIHIPSKVITFSATDADADIRLERGLIISRLDNWSGPLLDVEQCQLIGPHNAENLMAALAVGRVLRIPLEVMTDELKGFAPLPHCCEFVGEVNGVTFINDAKCETAHALNQALLAAPASTTSQPNIWLIAGGDCKDTNFHDAGPLLSRRGKGVFLFGKSAETMRAAWSLFTPCTVVNSLLEAFIEAVKNAATGDVVLLSPTCSSSDSSQEYQQQGEVYRKAVMKLKNK